MAAEPIWTPSPDLILQMCHIGWGMAIVLASASLGAGYWSIVVVGAWIILKEGVFDIFIEKSSVNDELVDSCFYLIGAGLAGIILWMS